LTRSGISLSLVGAPEAIKRWLRAPRNPSHVEALAERASMSLLEAIFASGSEACEDVTKITLRRRGDRRSRWWYI